MSRQAAYSCIIDGCKFRGQKIWGVQVHCGRMHPELAWKPEYEEMVKNGQTIPASTSIVQHTGKSQSKKDAGAAMITAMVRILRNQPNHEISTGQLLTQLEAGGLLPASLTVEAQRQRVMMQIKHHPEAGVSKAGRGLFRFVKPSVVSNGTEASVTPVPVTKEEWTNESFLRYQIEELQRRLRVKSEASIALLSVVGQLMMND